jgi:thiol:disulfide interchange protein DsbA
MYIAAMLVAMCFGTTVASAAPDTRKIDPPQPTEPGKIEVIEFFAYGCPHCASLETPFATWTKKQSPDVKVVRMPSNAPIAGVDSTVLFYGLEAIGLLDRLHDKIFDAIHNQRVTLGHEATRNKWLVAQGVDIAKFTAASKSFSVVTKINRAVQLAEIYRIASIPTVIVAGRNAISPGAEPPTVFLASLDKLVAAARQPKK